MSDDYPGSERHFNSHGLTDSHKRQMQSQNNKPARMTNEQRVEAIRKAAVSFANDYGPLPAANSGDETARHAVAHQLWKALRAQGLSIVQGDI